jgi:hypothetical protein
MIYSEPRGDLVLQSSAQKGVHLRATKRGASLCWCLRLVCLYLHTNTGTALVLLKKFAAHVLLPDKRLRGGSVRR